MKQKIDNALFSYRRLNLAGFFLTGSALSYASIALEQQLSSINCSLCSIVRLCLLCMSVVFFIAFVHNPWTFGQRFYALLNWLLSLAGLAAAARHTWLESFQHASPTACNAGIETLTASLPFLSDVHILLAEQHDCLDNSWHLLGFTLSQVTLGVFILLFLITWRLLTRRPEPKLLF